MASDLHPAVKAILEKSSFAGSAALRTLTKHLHSTWAKTFTSLPELYFQPESLQEIEEIVNLARQCRRRVTVVGSCHSPSTLTCTSSWLVNLDKFNKILSIDRRTGVVVMQSGIRLYELGKELDKHRMSMPNLGSIDHQSIAGLISTGTHGSSIYHALISEDIMSLRVTLANGTTKLCSPTENLELFRAALISLGALGIITEVTFRAVSAFKLRWKQVIDTDLKLFKRWDKDLWTHAHFVRVWWFPYTRRAVTWSAWKTAEQLRDPPVSYYDSWLGYYVYHNLLYFAQYVPRILPWVEWFTFGMQYGFPNGSKTEAIQKSGQALLMNCLYSQFVNEWAIPLEKGPEALRRLSSWLNHLTPDDPDYVPHNIPFSADGLYVHAPIEVRVADTSKSTLASVESNTRPYLDPSCHDGPTLYLNNTLYRPYNQDPPCRARYYQAFEWLMRDLGGRPHWAKNFDATAAEMEEWYGEDLEAWREVRSQVDREGMFVGPWHRKLVLGKGALLPLEEVEIERHSDGKGGVRFTGTTSMLNKMV